MSQQAAVAAAVHSGRRHPAPHRRLTLLRAACAGLRTPTCQPAGRRPMAAAGTCRPPMAAGTGRSLMAAGTGTTASLHAPRALPASRLPARTPRLAQTPTLSAGVPSSGVRVVPLGAVPCWAAAGACAQPQVPGPEHRLAQRWRCGRDAALPTACLAPAQKTVQSIHGRWHEQLGLAAGASVRVMRVDGRCGQVGSQQPRQLHACCGIRLRQTIGLGQHLACRAAGWQNGGCLGARARGPTRVVLPGDWTCPACSKHNFASRMDCYRCAAPRQAPAC